MGNRRTGAPPGFPLLLLALLTLIATACLVLESDPVEQMDRPPLALAGSNISEGQEDVPRDTRVELVFNQPLDPATLAGAELKLESGGLTVGGKRDYDLLARKVVFTPPGNLRRNLWYRFKLTKAPLSIMGTRAEENEISILFKTGEQTGTPRPPSPAAVDFAGELFPLFASSCGACHGPFNPMMGARFAYDTPEEFLAGAVATGSKEWKGWRIVDPGRHETSYLMYKLLGDDRLGLPTVTGATMPPPPDNDPLPLEAIEKVRDWIEQGAGSGKR